MAAVRAEPCMRARLSPNMKPHTVRSKAMIVLADCEIAASGLSEMVLAPRATWFEPKFNKPKKAFNRINQHMAANAKRAKRDGDHRALRKRQVNWYIRSLMELQRSIDQSC